MKRTYILMGVFVSLIGLPNARGQSIGPSTLNATGGTATIGGNVYDWSIGEMTMVSTFTGSSIIVTQGVLQPSSNTTAVHNASLTDNLQVFPNPASSLVNLQYVSAAQGTLTYRLMDMTGKTIMNNSTAVSQGVTVQQINIAALAAATYMLEVCVMTDGMTRGTTSYKIEKLN